MGGLVLDLRAAGRALRRTPSFTLVAVMTLALGIGATTAIFSVVNAVLLRPLPFPESDRIVRVYQIIPRPRVGTPLRGGLTPDQVQIWRDSARTVTHVALWAQRALTLTGEGDAVRLTGISTVASFFPLMGVSPLMGRTFTAADEQLSVARVVVVSHDTWVRMFGMDPDILERRLMLDRDSYQVVGVMPPGFEYPTLDETYREGSGRLSNAPSFWVPMNLAPPNPNPTRDVALAPALARVAAGVTLTQAIVESNTLVPSLFADREVRVDLVPLREEVVAPIRPALIALMAAVGFLMLITSANVTNLLLARATARQRELAVRLAVGGGRGHVLPEGRPVSKPHRLPTLQPADPDLRASQILHDRNGSTRPLRGGAEPPAHLALRLASAVGEVNPEDIHTRSDQAIDLRVAVACRTDRGNDLRMSHV